MLATYQRFAQANANNLVEEALAALPFSTGEMSDLRTFFVGRDFFDICTRIFGAVDMNGTQSIDKNELLDAFQQLLSELPGVTDILERRSLQPSVFCSSLSMELVSQTFQVFDVDQSGVLEWNEFPNAVRLIWVRALQLVKDRPVSDQLVEAALQNLADTCGVGLAKHLHAYFGSFDFSDLCTRVRMKLAQKDRRCLNVVRHRLQCQRFLNCNQVFEGVDADKSDCMSKRRNA